MRPLGALVNAASQIERGHYSDHIQVQGAREFQQLAGTFNSMQEGIREREARILRQATHDTLTGLLNREGLRERLAMLEHHGACSVALLDASLPRHHPPATRRAISCCRSRRAWARSAAQLPCARRCRPAGRRCAPRHELLHRVLVMADSGRRRRLRACARASTRACRVSGASRAPVEDLLRQADVALLQAKEQSTVAVVTSLARRRASLAYRWWPNCAGRWPVKVSRPLPPLVNMTDRVTVGFEALLRWSHPTLGSISPAEFVPLAERAGTA